MNYLHSNAAQQIAARENATQIPTYARWPIALVSGSGSYVTDADGREYLDFYGGHCVTLTGHCHPRVVRAINRQASTLMFYSNVVHSDVRARASEALVQAAGDGDTQVFFCNSGTEANETALKIARKATGRQHVIAAVGGFHGRTLGSLAATWNPSYREPYGPSLSHTEFIRFGDLDAAEAALAADPDVAAIILEPIQSMAGMVTAPPEYFQGLRRMCDAHGVMLILDEVQTGAGRTGTFLHSEALGVKPDMTTLAKSIGSGFPIGALLVSGSVAATIETGDQGTTFGGGMLASAALLATLEVVESEGLMERAVGIFDRIRSASQHLPVTVTGAGCLIGLRFQQPVSGLVAAMRERGVLVGGSAHPNVMRVMPPATATRADVDLFAETLTSVMAAHAELEVQA